MAEYKLELDIPFDELTEDGWSKVRLLRDVKSDTALSDNSNCWIEPTTGTLMLKPVQLAPEDWYNSSTNSLRFSASDLDYVSSYWQAHQLPYPGTGIHTMLRSMLQPLHLIEQLQQAAIAALEPYTGGTMIPVVATKQPLPANQGFEMMIQSHGFDGVYGKNYLGFVFGDFCIVLHTNGTADLLWSADGTNSVNSWVFRKKFKGTPDGAGQASIMTGGIHMNANTRLMVLPFGRGHIMIYLAAGGKVYQGIYTHLEAAYNSENGNYEITKAGKAIVYVNSQDTKNLGISLSKIGYKTSGTFDDILFTIPYAPTMTATKSVSWSKTTTGAPTVTGTLLDDAGAAWASDGTNNKIRMRLALTGDGTFSPYVDGYRIDIPEKIEHYEPTLLTVNESNIKSISLEDGEEWDDQRAEIQIIDRMDDVTIASLKYRSKINGRLMSRATDVSAWSPIGVYRFERPKIRYGRHRNLLTLSGKNLGVARIDRKRFTFAPSFNDAYHWAAVTKALNLGGFPSTVITTDVDAVKLPNTERNGEATDKGETEITCQPQFNSPLREFIDWIRANFSRWPLIYKADEQWYYQAIPAPTVAKMTFHAYRIGVVLPAGDSWYRDLESELEPPEGNKIVMIGRKDEGQLIARGAIDHYSADLSNTPIASGLNYIGWTEPIYYIDLDINTTSVLETCLNKVFDAASEAIYWVTWRAPYIPSLAINDAVAIEGLEGGLVQIKSISVEADTKKKLERIASTTYSGKWIAI